MGKIGDLFYEIRADTAPFHQALTQSKDTLGKFKSGLGDTLQSVTGLNIGMLGAAGAIGLLASGIKYAVTQAAEQQQILAQTNAVLKSTNGVSGMTAASIVKMADSMKDLNAIDDEAIIKASNVMLTFTQIGKETFPRAMQAAIDLSAAMGQDLQSSVVQIGKALGSPISGMTALQRVGVTFSAQQKELIANFVATNDVISAQKVILDELTKEFGGSGQAAADTYAGKVKALQIAVDDAAKAMGNSLLPALTKIADQIKWAITYNQKLNDAIQEQRDRIEGTTKSYQDYISQSLEMAVAAGKYNAELSQSRQLSIQYAKTEKDKQILLELTRKELGLDTQEQYQNYQATLLVTQAKEAQNQVANNNYQALIMESGANTEVTRALLAGKDANSAYTQSSELSYNAIGNTASQLDYMTSQFEASKTAIDNAKQSLQTFGESMGGDIKSALEQAGVKGEKLNEALGVMDEKFGTNLEWQQKVKDSASKLADQYAKTGDLETFRSQLDQNVSKLEDQNAKLREAEDLLRKSEAALAYLTQQEWDVKINYQVNGAIPSVPTAGYNPKTDKIGTTVFGGGQANGGPVYPGVSYMVGERGPEMFVPGQSGQIIRNDQIGGVTINWYGSGNSGDVKKLAQDVAREIQRARRN